MQVENGSLNKGALLALGQNFLALETVSSGSNKKINENPAFLLADGAVPGSDLVFSGSATAYTLALNHDDEAALSIFNRVELIKRISLEKDIPRTQQVKALQYLYDGFHFSKKYQKKQIAYAKSILRSIDEDAELATYLNAAIIAKKGLGTFDKLRLAEKLHWRYASQAGMSPVKLRPENKTPENEARNAFYDFDKKEIVIYLDGMLDHSYIMRDVFHETLHMIQHEKLKKFVKLKTLRTEDPETADLLMLWASSLTNAYIGNDEGEGNLSNPCEVDAYATTNIFLPTVGIPPMDMDNIRRRAQAAQSI